VPRVSNSFWQLAHKSFIDNMYCGNVLLKIILRVRIIILVPINQ